MKDPCDCPGCVTLRQRHRIDMERMGLASEETLNQKFDVVTRVHRRRAPLDRLGEIPRAMNALASQIAHGGDKYAVGDWRKQTREYFLAKILRHAIAAASGEILDEEGRPHLVAVMTNAAMATELEGKS